MAIYYSKTIVGPGTTGWLVAWMSNQLTQQIPQWPRLRIIEGQELIVSIDPRGGRFGLKCDTSPEGVQLCAVIEPDEQPEGQRAEHLLPFPPFQHELEPLKRICTTCNFLHPEEPSVDARFVAADADGSEWFECGNHPPTENAIMRLRVKLTSLEFWRQQNGLSQ